MSDKMLNVKVCSPVKLHINFIIQMLQITPQALDC